MPAAVVAFAEWALIHPVLAAIVRTILINVVLGANEIECNGEKFIAVGFNQRQQ